MVFVEGTKIPGSYRNEQNWVGTRGCSVEQASYVPIPQSQLQSGMDQWAKYVSETKELDTLVQLAIVHAEFEALHPFKDGNGRLGRMLIPLFLFERKLLSGPNFYMSGYLEARRDDYIDALRGISRKADWTEWCIFFLNGLVEQASENQQKAQEVIDLNRKMSAQVAEATHSEHSNSAVEFLFCNPIFASSHFVEHSHIPRPTALRFLRVLREKGVLRVIVESSGPRPAVYAFPELLNIAEGRRVFSVSRISGLIKSVSIFSKNETQAALSSIGETVEGNLVQRDAASATKYADSLGDRCSVVAGLLALRREPALLEIRGQRAPRLAKASTSANLAPMKFTPEFLDEIRARLPVSEVIGARASN